MKVNEIITNDIIKLLDKGVIPWEKPYRGTDELPLNFKTKKYYRGVNILLLYFSFKRSPYWLTYKQAKEINSDCKITKGTGHRILFAKTVQYEDDDGNKKQRSVFRYSTVFNLSDIEGIDCPYEKKQEEEIVDVKLIPIDNCQNLIDDLTEKQLIPEIIEHGRNVACYIPAMDIIHTPEINSYVSAEEYYSTLYHEIAHSTGHKSRLNRQFLGRKTKAYAKEELIAEISSCFICNHVGILTKTINNSVAYIEMWRERLSKDPNLIISAASKASDVMNYLQLNNEKPEYEIKKEQDIHIST